MSRRALCATCGKDRWLDRHTSCRTCRQPRGICSECDLDARLVARGLCYCCYQHGQVSAYLDELEAVFRPKSSYNQEIFALYLKYVRRYRLQYCHKFQVQKLKDLLEHDAWPTLRSWSDVYRLSQRFCLMHHNGKGNGCAVKKVGYMLQELGVLAAKDDDLRYLIEQAIAVFRPEIKTQVVSFATWLEKSGRAEATVVSNLNHLKRFDSWLCAAYPDVQWQAVTGKQICEHLDAFAALGLRPSRTRDAALVIGRFYRWLKLNRQVFQNPTEKFAVVSRGRQRLVVLAPCESRALIHFIQDESTPPEDAVLLALIMFFALRTEDLMHATIDTTGGVMAIALRRRRRSAGRHYFNRDQVLNLPRTPVWFAQLQDRFLDHWRDQYARTKVSYPVQRLFLPRNGRYNRSLSERTIVDRVYAATQKAINRPVPPSVLRQTSGDLHTKAGDGSLLTVLGWSPQFAFAYTWLPREIFTAR